MTGYGKSIIQLPTKKISIEVKSLNSKNLDLNTRMPSLYREKELSIRKLIASKLHRGKIDFSLYMEITGEETSTQINKTVVKQYIKQLKEVVDGDETELLKMAIRLPDAVSTERDEMDEDEWNHEDDQCPGKCCDSDNVLASFQRSTSRRLKNQTMGRMISAMSRNRMTLPAVDRPKKPA